MERYCKDVNTESLLCLSLAKQSILPAAYRYQGELASAAANIKAASGHAADTSSLDRVSGLVAQLEETAKTLEEAINHKAQGDILAHAKHFRDQVVPAMAAVRKVADDLEMIIADDLWPLPSYREMLFIR
jgi:glutamine synthetase